MNALLDDPVVIFSASRDPDAKLTFVSVGGRRLATKVPTTDAAAQATEAEGRLLVGLRRLQLGPLAATVPRYVASPNLAGRTALVSTALAGRPMSVDYHRWRHTSHPRAVRCDFTRAAAWLAAFQSATSQEKAPVTWADDVAETLRRRWHPTPTRDAALSRLTLAGEHIAAYPSPVTAVHGDFWFGNLLVTASGISGVVDWESGALRGSPLRDLARFPLSYALYLDRHVRPGTSVPGHPGLRRNGFAPGIGFVLLGRGWLPDEVRRFLGDGLERLGLSRGLWYDVALVGLAEIAATANDPGFGRAHLELVASLPPRPRGHRRVR